MPKAVPALTTDTATAPPLAIPPPVFDLARRHRALWKEANAFDERLIKAKANSAEHYDAQAGYERARDEAEAIDELIFTRPIATLADAAALAVHGHSLAERCAGSPHTGAVETMGCAFSRLALLLTEVAQVNLGEMGSGGTPTCLRRAAGLPGKEVTV